MQRTGCMSPGKRPCQTCRALQPQCRCGTAGASRMLTRADQLCNSAEVKAADEALARRHRLGRAGTPHRQCGAQLLQHVSHAAAPLCCIIPLQREAPGLAGRRLTHAAGKCRACGGPHAAALGLLETTWEELQR